MTASGATELAGPLAERARVDALDALRGVAVLGILLINIVYAGLGAAFNANPLRQEGEEGLNLLTWTISELLVEGTMRGLFSLLFGAGVVLMTSRLEARCGDVADIYYRRTLWLILFGIVHGYVLLWGGDVLYLYGLVGLFLYPLRRLAPRALLTAGVLALFAVSLPQATTHLLDGIDKRAAAAEAVALQQSGIELDESQQAAIDAWQDYVDEIHPPDDKVRGETERLRGGYVSAFLEVAPSIVYWQSTYTYQSLFWDALGMMLIGMGLLKSGVLTGERSTRFYLLLAALAYAIGLAVNGYETRLVLAADFDPIAIARADVTYDLGRLSIVLGHVGLVMLVCRSRWLEWLVRRLAAVGRMALTNYVMQTLIVNTIFIGFALYGELQRYELYFLVAAIWLLQLVASPVWLRRYRFGPLEWLWRALTYSQRPPMRRA